MADHPTEGTPYGSLKLPDPPSQLRTLLRLAGLMKPYKAHYIMALLSGAVASITTVATAPLVGASLDSINQLQSKLSALPLIPDQGPAALKWAVGLIMGALIIRLFALFGRNWFSQYVVLNLTADLREKIYAHIQRLSFATLDQSRTGELMARITNDVQKLGDFLNSAQESLVTAPITVLAGIIAIALIDWRVLILMAVIMGVVFLLLRFMTPLLRDINRQLMEILGRLTGELQEGIAILRLVQTQCTEEQEFESYRRINRQGLAEGLRFAWYASFLVPFVEFLGFLGPVVIFYYVAVQIAQGVMSAGELLALAGLAALMVSPLTKLSRVFVTIAQGTAPAERIFQILDLPIEIEDRPGAVELRECRGEILFDHVYFSYPGGEEVLRDFNLHIRPGMTVALVGASGAGKSTILNLIPRFYEAQRGRVLIDGIDVRDIKLASLRRHIGYVAQETILFHGTVRENLMYGCQGVDEIDLLNAAMAAGAHDFIIELPRGYDTVIGEGGVGLSGGQKQRIAIARALLKDPAILLLDEPTSALDKESEQVVQRALEKLMYGRTTLIAAHRLSTIKDADLIVVIRDGAIVETGTHRELIRRGGVYASFYLEEEVASRGG